jgi:PncC family amidohydrolase
MKSNILMQDLATQVVGKLLQANKKLAIAESLTGGLLSAEITTVVGASKVFQGSITAYQDEVKIKTLKVDAATISTHTSISELVALEMAENVKNLLGAQIGIATTGVAGPDSVHDFSPGLVFVALVEDDHKMCQKLVFKGSRQEIQQQSVEHALQMLNEYLV